MEKNENIGKNQINLLAKGFITKRELADAYMVTDNTIRSYLRAINIDTQGKRLTPAQVREFIDRFGEP
mgnify:CR=1 FL=1